MSFSLHMTSSRLLVCLAMSVNVCSVFPAQVNAQSVSDLAEVKKILKASIQDSQSASNPAQASEQLLEAATQSVTLLGPDHYATPKLKTICQESEGKTAASKVAFLQASLRKIHESLTFKPIQEAKLPEGYPSPTPVHHIEVKKLPACRLAQVEMNTTGRKGENRSFMALFQHIKRNDIAMTAPVEIEYQSESPDQELQERSMAFLYRTTAQGKPGPDEKDQTIEVVTVPEMLVVSIGCRGDMSESAVLEAQQQLKDWLSANQEKYTVAGPLRKLGYNSPFVPPFMRYFEVQYPVTPLPTNE